MTIDTPSMAGPVEWHALGVPEVRERLGTDLDHGLPPERAATLLVEHGRNEITGRGGPSRLDILFDQFRDVMVWILLAAAFISGVLLDELIDTWVIIAIVLLNAVLGYVQESRAADALAALKELSAPEALVVRGGEELSLRSAELVPGDLVVLEPGARVPADARVVEAIHMEAEEAALTGESLPVAKGIDPAPADSSLGDRTSMVYAGTSIAAGRGRAVVVATGRRTAMGQIAELLTEEEPPTPLSVELDRVGKRLAAIALTTAIIIFAVGLVRGNPAESMLLTAVALAVAAIPEGLPAVVTITLSRGVQRMAEQNALVRRLPAVEALGAATVVCTDKTGTLTRNEIRVQEVALAGRTVPLADLVDGDERVERFLHVAALCNDARPSADGHIGDPTEVALVWAVEGLGKDVDDIRGSHPRVDELSFDSRRKRMTTVNRLGDGYLIAMKGAPETVVERCDRIAGPDGVAAMADATRARMLQQATAFAERGLRTLALAYEDVPEPPADLEDHEHGLVLVGVVGMSDESRPEAAPAVREAQQAGIRVVMVTGDHEVTARAIATELGILTEGDGVMSGDRLRHITTEELAAEVDRYAVYARVDPVDKVKIVDAWQARDAIVAMTGDGVNDAPALLAADIGVAMGSGTDVAKDASSMVLADDNFATIISAVRQGRGIFADLRKVVHYLLSANAAEVLTMFVGFLVFGGLGEPLLAVQLLWINLVTDGLPALTLSLDEPEPGVMSGGVGDRNILSLGHQLRLLAFGAVMAVASLAMLVAGHYLLDLEWEEVRTAIFTTLVVIQLVHVFNVRLERSSVWRSGIGGNRWLLGAVVVSLLLQLAVVYTPAGQTLFDTVSLSREAWPWILGLSLASFVAISLLRLRQLDPAG